MKELHELQTRLVAPKNQKNSFGNYNYRSLEGIMECAKPLLKELNCTITFTDELVMLGERIFCKSTAFLKNSSGEIETSVSFAELDNHKGMSKEQSSGSASSYARKYAVCSLLAIDDSADPDMLDNSSGDTATKIEKNNYGTENIEVFKEFCGEKKNEEGINIDELKRFYKFYEQKNSTYNGFRETIDTVSKLWERWDSNALTKKPKYIAA